jgi:phosphoglycolate phosphatase
VPRRFDLLVADLDGPLVDSEAQLVGQVIETLRAHGFDAPLRRAIAETIGLPLDEVFRRAAPAADAGALEVLCVAYRRAADTPEFVSRFCLCNDVAVTLDALRAAGVRIVVATSKGRKTTIDILEHCRIRSVVDEVIGGDCVRQGKPHPEMVERARELFPASADRTMVVGDTSFDMEMGKAAGVATCAVTYGMQSVERLSALRPTFMIDRFEELGRLLLE